MLKHRARAVFLLIAAAAVGYFVYVSSLPGGTKPFRLGLDLSGGTHLVYSADVSKVGSGDISQAMDALKEVVERRVNLFGVSEPLVQTEMAAALSSEESAYKLIVELPGVTNSEEAIRQIGETPKLEFRLATADDIRAFQASLSTSTPEQDAAFLALFKETGLTGTMVSRAGVSFDPTTNVPAVDLSFTSEGRALFADVTKANVGNYLGIFLDGNLKSWPVVRDAIMDGRAQISGSFTLDEVKTLVRDLNFGALPIPIELISTQTIGPSLGQAAVNGGIKAGIISFIIIALFLIIWYRLPGFIASVALAIYIILSLAIFKIGISMSVIAIFLLCIFLAMSFHWFFGFAGVAFYILMAFVPGAMSPVTLTAAGIAAFILSIGMAVDANILIFERMKEELARGKGTWDAMHEGFARAWTSIRDSNISSIITGVILFAFGSTSVIKGFALVFIIGVLISMFTAITASRLFLYSAAPAKPGKLASFLISNGFRKAPSSAEVPKGK